MPVIASIPKRYEEGFRELGSISDADYEVMKEALLQAPLVSSILKLALLVDEIGNIPETDTNEIFESIGGLTAAIDRPELIDEITTDIITICVFKEIIQDEKFEMFYSRVNFLLKNEQIFYASKADTLINSYGNKFIQGRIITDIRTIFDYKVEGMPKAGIVLHNLNIHYQSNEEPYHKDITLVLNAEDIKALKEVLDRAETKQQSLQQLFDKSELINLNK